ncbi:MAG: TonB-dependent siderophore receptor [Pseudomonadota bacterium]|nr:TonB-dependent siderophore receptor [Pseudomonadota bacterium]
MAHRHFKPARIALAAAGCCALSTGLHAQSAAIGTGSAPERITITGQSIPDAGVAGFGNIPLVRAPLQASVYNAQQLDDAGVQSIGGLTRLDASLGDAYNAEGYWSIISARGYTLDNRFNYRRDGLPINAETAIALDNKERLEVLKGTSGIQAGTSAPGGLVNLVVKRPVSGLRHATLGFRERGSVLGSVDLSERFGAENAFGLRLNLAAERLDPKVHNTEGERSLVALAGDWQLNPDSLLQAEFESSRQRQPSVAGYSMLGNTVPPASSIDRLRNLNYQPWVQPVVLNGDTASLRWQQRLGADWRLTAQAMQQRLKSDDRTAFPYGVYDANTYECPQWCDRFAPDGTFTYWQFVSDNERRTTTNLALSVAGDLQTGPVSHTLETGVLRSRYQARFEDQVFDIAGLGKIDGSLVTPPSPGTPDANTNRDETSTEFFVRDAMKLGERFALWVGLRHTSMDRSSVRTSPDSDGSLRATDYDRTATTPWIGASWQLAQKTMLYASWGRGLETDVAPNRPSYVNAGQSLALQSRQFEVGLKHGTERVEASVTLFDIDRGVTSDIGECKGPDTCATLVDGSDRHRGIEAQWVQRVAAWTFQGSAMLLQAKRHGAADESINGKRPVNVPKATLRLGTEYRVAAFQSPALQDLTLMADLIAESDRKVLPYDDSVHIPGWSRVDLGARWQQRLSTTLLTWRVGVDNITNRQAWKESPYQFTHVYLYPLAPRTWRASVQAAF